MNKFICIGNLTKDPEMRRTASDIPVCTFSVAVNRRVDKNAENAVDYFNVVAWRQLGENCYLYLKKGKKAAIVGELQTRSYDDKDGTKRYVTEIIASEVEFLSPKDEGAAAPAPAKKTLGNEPMDIDSDSLPF